MTHPTDDYPVNVSHDALRACCAAYEVALYEEETARIVVPDDLTSHAEVRGMLAALPIVLRDELRHHLDVAFPDGGDGDGYGYALERLRDSVVARYGRVARWVDTATSTEDPP